LLREKYITSSDMGLDENITYIDLPRLDDNLLQLVADFVVERVKIRISPQTEGSKLSCEYVGEQLI
jgi:hypothetical protein